MTDEFISKQDAINIANDWLLDCFKVQKQDRSCGLIRRLEDSPSANVVPVVHAHWKDNKNGTVSCSRCSTWFQKERVPYLRFCGYCGARMDGKGEE